MVYAVTATALELKCPFTSRDFMKLPARGWFRGHKIGLHGPGAVQHVGDAKRCLALCQSYDPRMKREGLHYVVTERNEKYMANFDEMVPEFIEKMDVALAEAGFVFGEQWR